MSAPHDYPLTLAGETLVASPERALFWARHRILFIADWHIGKDAALRSRSVAIPPGPTQTDLSTLDKLLALYNVQTLFVLGDLLHARTSLDPTTRMEIVEWRERHSTLEIQMIRGNHDRHAGDPPKDWQITVRSDSAIIAPFVMCHEPCASAHGFVLCGHVHPGVILRQPGFRPLRFPCFHATADFCILPAFSRFTGLAPFQPSPEDQVLTIVDGCIVALETPGC